MEAIMYFVKYETMQHYLVAPEHYYNRKSYTCTSSITMGTNLRSAMPRLSHAKSCLLMSAIRTQ